MSGGLNHHKFQEILKQTEAEHVDLTYLSNVQWLAADKCQNEYMHSKKRFVRFWRRQTKITFTLRINSGIPN